MPASSRPSPGAPSERETMPTSARVAVAVLALLAILLLLYAVVTWLGRDILAEQLVEANEGVDRAEALRFVLITAAPYLVLGLLSAAAAIGLPRRRPWARFLGLGATAALVVLTLITVFSVGGVTATSLFVLVLSVAGVTSLLARTSTDWVRRRPAED